MRPGLPARLDPSLVYPVAARPRRSNGLLHALVAPFMGLVRLYRRSLTFRVLTGTVVLSSVSVALVGWLLMQQVSAGLLNARVTSVVAEAGAGARSAQAQIDSADTSGNTSQLLTQLTSDIATRGGGGSLYGVVLVAHGPGSGSVNTGSTRFSGGFLPSSAPDDLRAAVRTDVVAYRYAPLQREDGGTELGIVTGTQVVASGNGLVVDLFYLFPVQQEQDTLQLVSRALLSGGVLVVLLVSLVAWLVTRQVVAPVRMAREVSERLAAGRLEERMTVGSGHDDLARLGTSINHMATNLQRQIGQLEELTGVQRRFVSDVSHELRTPLTTVRMAADVLFDERDSFDPGSARATELMHEELDRFESLLTDLLEISRFDAGAAALEPEEIDLRDVTRKVMAITRGLASKRGVEVSLAVPAEPCLVEADIRRVERILRNLVSNAIEYGNGSDVSIRVASNETAAAVVVRDHGIGLAPGEATLVFNRFWRADPARAKTRGGTGLGLAIAHEDAQLHGGWLQAWGEPGEGANFRLVLPRKLGATLTHPPLPLVPTDIVLEQVRRVGAAYQRFQRPDPGDRGGAG
ncbi:MAG TPA: MtrAB system histidine kinase MtrB [Actinopolymorphaceae bacterium]|jgi:two-component system sensor histidine kinase MtrB